MCEKDEFLSVRYCYRMLFWLVSDLPGEDRDPLPVQEGQGIDGLILALENSVGDLVLVHRTEVKERRTESADRKVFQA